MGITSARTRRLIAAAVVVGLVVAGSAGAVSVAEQDVTDDERVGETITATVTLDELYQNPNYEEWSVAGETELRNVTWTVEFIGQTGEEIRQVEVDGQSLNGSAIAAPEQLRVDANAETPPAEVQVQVTGDVPPVEQYRYPELDSGEGDEPESFLVLSLTQDRGAGGTANSIDSWRATHYTTESREARQALDEARDTIREARQAGADVGEAEDLFGNARSAYRNENFENAVELAEDAESNAQSALEGQQSGGLSPLVIGAGVVVVLVAVGVGAYLYRGRQESDTKLR